MADKKTLLAVLMFGSLWGLLESTLGAYLHLFHLPAGAVMASIALALMVYTRKVYGVRGMQFAMAVVASFFKLSNLGFIGGCVWCPVYAILAEGVLFEMMLALPWIQSHYSKRPLLAGASMGYVVYCGGYFLTEILTPLFSPAGFFPADLVNITPLILSRGLYALVFSALALPLALRLSAFSFEKLSTRTYYISMSFLTAAFWFAGVVLG